MGVYPISSYVLLDYRILFKYLQARRRPTLDLQPKFETIDERYFVGKWMKMTYSNNPTIALWESFMPHEHVVENRTGDKYYAIEVYSEDDFFENFSPDREFVKWATVEVEHLDDVPDEMESIKVPAGKYAVFPNEGSVSKGSKAYQEIFETWLPQSDYTLDDRPHLAVMRDIFDSEHPESEEEIWIPVKS